MEHRFPMTRCWATRFLWPMLRGSPVVLIEDGMVRVRLGLLGRADIPAAKVERLSRMRWPWWGGIGARLGRRLVAFVTAWGDVALLELEEPIDVRAPMRWRTPRVVISVVDVDEFLRAVAHARVPRRAAAD